jgi:CheY-like chemotaxis protein
MSASRSEVLVVNIATGADKQISAALADSGYLVTSITDPDTCLAKIRDEDPVLVFLGLFDNTWNVADLLRQVRALEAELPVVLMANEDTAQEVIPLLEAGATDYLLFPVPDESLITYCVRHSIERRRDNRKRRRGDRDLKRLNKALVESLKVLEMDQQAGFRVQQGMMPDSPYLADGFTLRHLIVPSLILSGDFIDYFELPDGRLLFYIADVSGHGASGAIVTVLLKSLSGRLFGEVEELGTPDAGEVLAWFNRELLACHLEQHVTMFLGLLSKNGRKLQYANAAHFPATILQSKEMTRYLEVGGLPLGIYPTASYDCREVTLPEVFTMVMFSDGVFEILPEQTLKAKEDHLLSLVQCDLGDIDTMADHLGLGEVKEVPDDIAVFTVARAG